MFRRTTNYKVLYTILSRSKPKRYQNKKRKVFNGGEHNPEICKREIYDIDISTRTYVQSLTNNVLH